MDAEASIADAPDRGTDVIRDTDPATNDATPAESDALGWLPECVELSSDEWVIYPPGEPRPVNFVLRFGKAVSAVPVSIDFGGSPGVYVLPYPDGPSVLARFGDVTNDSVCEFEPPPSSAECEAVAARTQTWVERVDDQAERAHIRTTYAPVPNTDGRVLRALFDHFGGVDTVAAAVPERNTTALTWASGVAEQTAADLVIHYSINAEWEHYRRHRDAAP